MRVPFIVAHEATIAGTEWLTTWRAYLNAEPFAFFAGLLFADTDDGLAGLPWRTRGVDKFCDDFGDRAERMCAGFVGGLITMA
jgi:hypothetical protein